MGICSIQAQCVGRCCHSGQEEHFIFDLVQNYLILGVFMIILCLLFTDCVISLSPTSKVSHYSYYFTQSVPVGDGQYSRHLSPMFIVHTLARNLSFCVTHIFRSLEKTLTKKHAPYFKKNHEYHQDRCSIILPALTFYGAEAAVMEGGH